MPVDPNALRLTLYPAAILRQKTRPVPEPTDEVRAVARRMIEIMREAEGVGLAAPQVGLGWRMFVADVPPAEDRSPESDPPTATSGPVVYINPVLFQPEGGPEPSVEGCLSLPEISGEVMRSPVISIRARNLAGQEFTARAGGLLARCWQHECDHLDGVLILDRMTQMSRLKNRTAVKELERDAEDR